MLGARLTRLVLLGMTIVAASACHGGDGAADPAPATANATATATTVAPVDPRDQYALAQEIIQARASREQLETALARTRSAWIGRRYRWELAFVPALCGETGPCVVMPFDHHHDPEHPIRQGWLPRLELEGPERQALADACLDHAPCIVEVSGDLGQLELSTEQPTSMTLSQVELHGTREAEAGESWVLGPRRVIAGRRTPPARAG